MTQSTNLHVERAAPKHSKIRVNYCPIFNKRTIQTCRSPSHLKVHLNLRLDRTVYNFRLAALFNIIYQNLHVGHALIQSSLFPAKRSVRRILIFPLGVLTAGSGP